MSQESMNPEITSDDKLWAILSYIAPLNSDLWLWRCALPDHALMGLPESGREDSDGQ